MDMALMNIYVNFIDSLIKVSSQDCKQTAFVFLLSKKYLYEVVDLLIDSGWVIKRKLAWKQNVNFQCSIIKASYLKVVIKFKQFYYAKLNYLFLLCYEKWLHQYNIVESRPVKVTTSKLL